MIIVTIVNYKRRLVKLGLFLFAILYFSVKASLLYFFFALGFLVMGYKEDQKITQCFYYCLGYSSFWVFVESQSSQKPIMNLIFLGAGLFFLTIISTTRMQEIDFNSPSKMYEFVTNLVINLEHDKPENLSNSDKVILEEILRKFYEKNKEELNF